MIIPATEWAPDIAEGDSGVMARAENVIPGANSYMPVLGPAPYSLALSAAPRALVMAQQKSGAFLIFAATATTLNKLNPATGAFDDVSRLVGGAYAVASDELVSMAQFGTALIAVNINDAPQTFDVEAGSNFTALGGSPPQARIVDVVEGHVMLGSLSSDPSAVHWSGVENATQWTAGSNGSDIQSFADGGRVMAIAGAAKIIVQERALRRIIHQPADPSIFTFDKIEDAKGAIAPYSVIPFGATVAYLAEDGFWFNGEPIGKDKIDRFFFAEVNQQRLFSVLGTFDPTRPLLYWAYRTGATDLYDRMLIYNWRIRRWSVASIDQYILSNVATPGLSLEALDALYASLEDVAYSLDSRIWLGGRPVFGAIGSDLRLSFLEGSPLEATLETGERQIFEGGRALVRVVAPRVDTAQAIAAVGRREREADTRAWTAESAMQASGNCPVRAGGRHHRFRTRIPSGATWTHYRGVEVTATPLAGR